MGVLVVKKIRSTIGESASVRKTLYSMGLRRMNSVRKYPDNNCMRGMVNKVCHLIEVRIEK